MIRGPRNDLTGQTFNEWTALKYEGKSKYLCRCSCGVERVITSYALLTGRSKSCGHLPDTIINDLTGQKFGEWTAIEYRGKARWLCRCSCGTERVIRSYDLRQGLEHCKNPIHNSVYNEGNLTGKHFGEWEVLKYAGGGNWLCRCSCGKEALVLTHHLIRGNSRSCGHTKIIDLTGKTFGEFKVLKYTGNGKWLCKCSCGKEVEVFGHNLKNGTSTSCGCKTVEKIKQTMLDRYGVDSYAKIEKTAEQLDMVSSRDKFIACIDEFGYKPTTLELADKIGYNEPNTCKLIHKYNAENLVKMGGDWTSSYESELLELFPEGEQSNRNALHGKELDILFHEKGIAIEFNGSYWHSDVFKSETDHQNKSLMAKAAGIRIIHIFEHEWKDEVTRNKIIHLINRAIHPELATKFQARKCEVKEIDSSIAAQFINKYHLQNYSPAKVNIGIYSLDELLGVMTFGKPRFDNNIQYELIRLAWKDDIVVVGGAAKLFKYFVEKYNPDSIVTYCDIAKFSGSIYELLEFKFIETTRPSYIWWKNNKILTRYQTMKSKLVDEGLGKYGDTESDIMHNLGWVKIYNCGNYKYIWNKVGG